MNEPIPMKCEHDGCNNLAVYDCEPIPGREVDGWGSEPEAMCAEHAKGRVVISQIHNGKQNYTLHGITSVEQKDTPMIERIYRLAGENERLKDDHAALVEAARAVVDQHCYPSMNESIKALRKALENE